MNICLVAIFGTGLLCSGGSSTVSDFCEVAGPQIVQLQRMTAAELAVMPRSRKNAIRNLRQDYKRLCQQ